MKVENDEARGIVTVDGLRFASDFFSTLASAERGARFQIVRPQGRDQPLTLLDLRTPERDLHDRLSAYDFGQQLVNGGGGAPSLYVFSIDRDRAAAALRKLADRIEAGTVTMGEAHVETIATPEDFGATTVRLKLHELLPP